MTTNDLTLTHEEANDLLLEQIRSTFSRMLKTFLQLYAKYDRFKTDMQAHTSIRLFHQMDVPYFDDKGKVNWDIILQIIPPNIEKHIKEEYNMLNKNEIRLCCLLFFDVSPKNIATILPYKKMSVYSILSKIKLKTGTKDITEMYRKIILKTILTST